MKKTVTKNTATFWFVVAAVWFVTLGMDFLNEDSTWLLYLFHGGCGIACVIVGIRSYIQFKNHKDDPEDSERPEE